MTQGDRHSGTFGCVREALREENVGELATTGFFILQGSYVEKEDPRVWFFAKESIKDLNRLPIDKDFIKKEKESYKKTSGTFAGFVTLRPDFYKEDLEKIQGLDTETRQKLFGMSK